MRQAEQFQGATPNCARRQRHAGCNSAADRRGQRFWRRYQRQNRRTDRATYKGDHEKMKQAINNVAIVLQTSEGIGASDRCCKEGHLAERGKHDQFKGAYAEIVRGVNAVLDA